MNIKGVAAVAAALASTALAPQAAEAQTGAYAGLGYTNYSSDAADVGGVTGRVGYRFGKYIGLEGEMTFGVQEDTFHVAGTPPVDVDVGIEDAYAVAVVGFLPLGDNTDLFARVGQASIEVFGRGTSGGTTSTVSADFEGLTYGFGAQHFFGERFGVRGEYNVVEGDLGDVDSFAVSGVWRF